MGPSTGMGMEGHPNSDILVIRITGPLPFLLSSPPAFSHPLDLVPSEPALCTRSGCPLARLHSPREEGPGLTPHPLHPHTAVSGTELLLNVLLVKRKPEWCLGQSQTGIARSVCPHFTRGSHSNQLQPHLPFPAAEDSWGPCPITIKGHFKHDRSIAPASLP